MTKPDINKVYPRWKRIGHLLLGALLVAVAFVVVVTFFAGLLTFLNVPWPSMRDL